MRTASSWADVREDEVTVERVIEPTSQRATLRRGVDPALLAATRDAEPVEDPFGGLIPVPEDEDEYREAEVLDSELLELVPESNGRRLAKLAIPYLRVAPSVLAGRNLDPRCGFLLPHIDGQRTIREIASACLLEEAEVFELLWWLLEHRMVALATQRDRTNERR